MRSALSPALWKVLRDDGYVTTLLLLLLEMMVWLIGVGVLPPVSSLRIIPSRSVPRIRTSVNRGMSKRVERRDREGTEMQEFRAV